MLPAGLLPAPPLMGETLLLNISDHLSTAHQVKGEVIEVGECGLVDLFIERFDVIAYGVPPYLMPAFGSYWRWLR